MLSPSTHNPSEVGSMLSPSAHHTSDVKNMLSPSTHNPYAIFEDLKTCPSCKIEPDTSVESTCGSTTSECASNNVYIRNLLPELDESWLRKEFSRFGLISSAKIMTKNGVSKGYGFVQFTDADMAAAAVEALNGSFVGEQSLYCKLADRDKDRGARNEPSNNLYIGNLPTSYGVGEVSELFGVYGPISSLVVLSDPVTGGSRGVSLVRFHTVEDGSRCIEALNGVVLEGHDRPLEVKYAETSAEKHQRKSGKKRSSAPKATRGRARQAREPTSPTESAATQASTTFGAARSSSNSSASNGTQEMDSPLGTPATACAQPAGDRPDILRPPGRPDPPHGPTPPVLSPLALSPHLHPQPKPPPQLQSPPEPLPQAQSQLHLPLQPQFTLSQFFHSSNVPALHRNHLYPPPPRTPPPPSTPPPPPTPPPPSAPMPSQHSSLPPAPTLNYLPVRPPAPLNINPNLHHRRSPPPPLHLTPPAHSKKTAGTTAPTGAVLKISGLPPLYNEVMMYQLFSPFGAVDCVTVPTAPANAGTAFIRFRHTLDASSAATHLQGAVLQGRGLKVEFF